MSGRMIGYAAMLVAATLLAGCGSIGTVNGVRMNATSAPDAFFCDKNPEICVAAGVAVIAGVAYVVSDDNDDDKDEDIKR